MTNLQDVLKKIFKLEELENPKPGYILENLKSKGFTQWNQDEVVYAQEAALKDCYRPSKFSDTDLWEKYSKGLEETPSSTAAIAIVRERTRGDLKEHMNYYHVWRNTVELNDYKYKVLTGVLENDLQSDNRLRKFLEKSKSKFTAFICHKSKENCLATKIKYFLELYEVDTFIDDINQRGIPGDYKKSIKNEIKNRNIFIVLATNDMAIKNKNVEIDPIDEINFFEDLHKDNKGKLRINAILEDLKKENESILKINNTIQYINNFDGEEKDFNDILNHIIIFFNNEQSLSA